MKSLPNRSAIRGFSIVELMVAMSILSVLMLMLTALLDQIQKSWRFSEARISQFREARVAFDLMAKNIGQASLNTYWDVRYDNEGMIEGYVPTSELHFVTMTDADQRLPAGATQTPMGHAIFFQAPLGFSTQFRNLNNLFNGRGYFVSWGSDKRFKPSFVNSPDRYRFRLMEFRPPAESNQVFQDGLDEREKNQDQMFDQWFKQALSVGDGSFEDHLNPLAENIIALVISPRDTIESTTESRRDSFSRIAPNFAYDSNDPNWSSTAPDQFAAYAQQVPPLIRLTMVAIDEGSATRMGDGSSMPQAITSALQGLFRTTNNFEKDIEQLSERLSDDSLPGGKVDFKVFSTLVLLRSAKWSGR